MPTLEFKGKQHIYAHHLTVPYRPLEPDETRSCRRMLISLSFTAKAPFGFPQNADPIFDSAEFATPYRLGYWMHVSDVHKAQGVFVWDNRAVPWTCSQSDLCP